MEIVGAVVQLFRLAPVAVENLFIGIGEAGLWWSFTESNAEKWIYVLKHDIVGVIRSCSK